MAATEGMTGVKITAICPGVVQTPLFTADKEKISQYSYQDENALKPGEVAESMLGLLQEKKFGCGTVLEISKAGTRVIPEWGVEPPSGLGTGLNEEEVAAGMKALLGPIEKKLAEEKGSRS